MWLSGKMIAEKVVSFDILVNYRQTGHISSI